MNDLEYQKAAQVTLSHSFFGEFVSVQSLQSILVSAIAALSDLDRIKKILFYGRGVENLPIINTERAIGALPLTGTEETIIHALIGSATEAGEKLEALSVFLSYMEEHKAGLSKERPLFDIINLVEESGDSFWYEAVFAEAVGTHFAHIKQVNIDKLKKRYQSKFDAFEANNRDLQVERKVLEGLGRVPMNQPFSEPKLSDADLAVRLNIPVFADDSGMATFPDGSYTIRIPGESEETFKQRVQAKFQTLYLSRTEKE